MVRKAKDAGKSFLPLSAGALALAQEIIARRVGPGSAPQGKSLQLEGSIQALQELRAAGYSALTEGISYEEGQLTMKR